MSTRSGSQIAGSIPPHIPKTKTGRPAHRTNKYAKLKPSDQRNTAGQRRKRLADAWHAFVHEEIK